MLQQSRAEAEAHPQKANGMLKLSTVFEDFQERLVETGLWLDTSSEVALEGLHQLTHMCGHPWRQQNSTPP